MRKERKIPYQNDLYMNRWALINHVGENEKTHGLRVRRNDDLEREILYKESLKHLVTI